MASNKELRGIANGIAKDLGLDIGDISQTSNADLAALVKDLRAKKVDAETTTAADTATKVDETEAKADAPESKDEATKAPEPEAKDKGPVVAKGKCVTSKVGLIAEGQSISPDDLAGGEDAFKLLKSKGYIV